MSIITVSLRIKPKNKKCIECGREDLPHFSRKRCINCAKKSYKKPKQVSAKQKIKKQERSSVRNEYFDYHISNCKFSEETGKPIYSPNRANCCHIFDKGRHKSLQAHLTNCVYLTLDEHTLLDNHLFKLEFDKIQEKLPNTWKLILERSKILLPLCEERTRFYYKIKEYLEKT